MNKFLAGLFIYSLTIALSVAVMICGWGLKPVSWWWIIGGYTLGYLLLAVLRAVSAEEKGT